MNARQFAPDSDHFTLTESRYRRLTGERRPTPGWIYAYTFPALQRDGVYPIKVGLTTGDVDTRVRQQCSTSAFEAPIIIGRWRVSHVHATEAALHSLLKAKGHWKSDAIGVEWFTTTLDTITAALEAVCPMQDQPEAPQQITPAIIPHTPAYTAGRGLGDYLRRNINMLIIDAHLLLGGAFLTWVASTRL